MIPVKRGAVALGLALSLALLACGCTGCEGSGSKCCSPAPDAGKDGGRPDAGPDAGASDAGCPDPTEAIPAEIPAGWLRAPCVPADCDIYYAPELSLARPASPWASRSEGGLELVVDWGMPRDAIMDASGASNGSVRYIAYTRRLSDKERWELQIVRLPENELVFDALSPWTESNDVKCVLYPDALSFNTAVYGAMTGVNDGAAANPEVILAVVPGDPVPRVLARHPVTDTPLEAVAGDGLWLATYGRKTIYWQDMQPSDEMQVAWKSPDGRLAYALSAAGTTAFFSANGGHSFYESYAWDPDGGARTLLAFPDAELGGACCVASDGKDMVWQQGSGAFDAEKGTYERVDVMASPHASYAAEVEPRWLHQSYANYVDVGAETVVGGGYALIREVREGGAVDVVDDQYTLTRLSDGAYWVLTPRAGFKWGKLLFVDAEELALVESAGKGAQDAGARPNTIVRLRIDALGPPTPADAGAP